MNSPGKTLAFSTCPRSAPRSPSSRHRLTMRPLSFLFPICRPLTAD